VQFVISSISIDTQGQDEETRVHRPRAQTSSPAGCAVMHWSAAGGAVTQVSPSPVRRQPRGQAHGVVPRRIDDPSIRLIWAHRRGSDQPDLRRLWHSAVVTGTRPTPIVVSLFRAQFTRSKSWRFRIFPRADLHRFHSDTLFLAPVY
jgi:hypothetical protein